MNDKEKLETLLKRKNISPWTEKDEDPLAKHTNKWEITPRTATQSKRLKWDQTPLGYIRIEGDNVIGGKVRDTSSGWDHAENTENVGITCKNMTIREVNMCLPSKGYTRYDIIPCDTTLENICNPEDLPEIAPDEREFFSPIFQSKNKVEQEIYKALLLIKNGDKKMRRYGMRELVKLQDKKSMAIEILILMMISIEINNQEKLKVMEVIPILLETPDVKKTWRIKEIMYILNTYFQIRSIRDRAFGLLSLLFKMGIEPVFEIIRGDIYSDNYHVRENAGGLMATLAFSTGIESVIPHLHQLTQTKLFEPKSSCIKALQQLALMCGRSLLLEIDKIFDLLVNLVSDNNKGIRIDAANCIYAILRAISPFRSFQTKSIFFILKRLITSSEEKELEAMIKAMSLLCKEDERLTATTFDLLRTKQMSEYVSLIVFDNIYQQIPCAESVDFFLGKIDLIFSKSAEVNKTVLINISAEMCKHEQVVEKMLQFYSVSDNVGTISEIFGKAKVLHIKETSYSRYIDCIRYALNNGDENTIKLIDKLLSKISVPYTLMKLIIEDAQKWLSAAEKIIRIRGICVLREITNHMKTRDLIAVGNILFENLQEKDYDILALIIKAMVAVYNCYRFKSAEEIVSNILPVFKTKNVLSSEAAIFLLHTVCLNDRARCEKIDIKEWIRVVYEITDMFSSPKRSIRRKVSETLGLISGITGPQEILNILMEGLVSEDKNHRAGAADAIAVLAERNGIYSVLPTLLADYSLPDSILQQGIIRTIGKLYQRLGHSASYYTCHLLQIVEDNLTDIDSNRRVLGMKLIKNFVLVYQKPNVDEGICVHLLNLMWINVIDTSPLVNSAFNVCIEAFSTLLEPGLMLNYILQGLFHPATRVRQRYTEILTILFKIQGASVLKSIKVLGRSELYDCISMLYQQYLP